MKNKPAAWLLFVPLAIAVLASGCTAPAAPAEPDGPPADVVPLSSSKPTFVKQNLVPVAAGDSPIDELIANLTGDDPNVLRFQVPEKTGWMQLAMDFGDPADQGKPSGEITFVVKNATGGTVFDSGRVTEWRKAVQRIDHPASGEYVGRAVAQGDWKVGLVVAYFPEDYTPGLTLNISSPTQTRVEHAFYPPELAAKVGVATRVTLFDYDPHYGVDNDQHNFAVAELDVRTTGKTHWGEVFTVDFTPAKAGEFTFECEYHNGMEGKLIVTA